MSSTVYGQPGHAAAVRLRDLAHEVWRGRMIVAAFTAVAMLIALVLAITATPQYRAAVLLAPAEGGGPEGGLAGIASRLGGLGDLDMLNMGAGQDVDQALVMLSSRSFTEQFIVEQQVLPHLYKKRWDASRGEWRKGTPNAWQRLAGWWRRTIDSLGSSRPTAAPTDGSPDLWEATKKFDRMRKVDKDRRTQIVTLSVTWQDPQLAATWANNLAKRLNDHARQRAIQEASTGVKYLNAEVGKTNVLELQQALYRLLESQQKKIMLATVREEYAFRILDPALAPRERISPKRTLMVLSGLIGGAFIGILFVLARRFVLQPA